MTLLCLYEDIIGILLELYDSGIINNSSLYHDRVMGYACRLHDLDLQNEAEAPGFHV